MICCNLPTIALLAAVVGQPGALPETKDSESFAPMTCWGVHVKRGDDEVWSAPERYGKSTERGLYHVWVHSREVAP